MQLKINGKNEIIDNKNFTVTELLRLKNINKKVIVELNHKIIEDFSTILKEGDCLEILYFMGGG
ncbi:MAG: sulfur carrier protein ThiS [bacterium]|nr:sulfur carrier protein ThiS [bacterium]